MSGADFDVHVGDMREVLASFEPNSIDSVVTDPPYGLSFMGKGWDRSVPGVEFWQEALRVAKPGAHLLAFGGTRTYHRLMCAIEDAGWEIRDCIMWVYGSGFPKSHNLKGEWQGWGTTLKPAWEPIIVARKPIEGTVAQNVLKHGTGGLNIDGCRISWASEADAAGTTTGFDKSRRKGKAVQSLIGQDSRDGTKVYAPPASGRWPANLIHDGSDEVVSLFPETGPSSRRPPSDKTPTGNGLTHGAMPGIATERGHDDNGGSAARFFYCAKANKKDRGEGNPHSTVKPTDLMRYCVKLVTRPGGTVLDPFMGSGSTGKAAMLEGMNFIGIDLSPEYAAIATKRIYAAQNAA